ncbi:MAG: dihydrofolate reductase [Pseudomonadota bacterium]
MTILKPKLPIALVVAVAKNGVIGNSGGMPWKLSSDLKRFKRDTMGKPILMGRKTFQSIGKALPGRLNIVISRSDFSADNIVHAKDIASALFLAEGWAQENEAAEISIIGGGQIYTETIGLATKLYVTHVMAEPEGDTYFPKIEEAEWRPQSREEVPKSAIDTAETLYVVYERVSG